MAFLLSPMAPFKFPIIICSREPKTPSPLVQCCQFRSDDSIILNNSNSFHNLFPLHLFPFGDGVFGFFIVPYDFFQICNSILCSTEAKTSSPLVYCSTGLRLLLVKISACLIYSSRITFLIATNVLVQSANLASLKVCEITWNEP